MILPGSGAPKCVARSPINVHLPCWADEAQSIFSTSRFRDVNVGLMIRMRLNFLWVLRSSRLSLFSTLLSRN